MSLYAIWCVVNISVHAVGVCDLDRMVLCALMTWTATGMWMNMWCWSSLPSLTPYWPRKQLLRCRTLMQQSAPTFRHRSEPPRRPADRQLKKNVTCHTYITCQQKEAVTWETVSVCASSSLVFTVRQTGSIAVLHDKVTVGMLNGFCRKKLITKHKEDWRDQRNCGQSRFLKPKMKKNS